MIRDFFKYVLLNILSMLGVSVYVLSDTYFIANGIGTDALSALNLVLPYFSLIIAIGLMIGMGTATRYSILSGAQQKRKANCVLIHGLFLTVIFGSIISIIGYFLASKIAIIMGADKTLFPLAKDYLETIFLFAWAMMLNTFVLSVLRAVGLPKLATVSALTGSFCNIILDYIFIYMFKMGMFGAALASGVSPIFSLGYSVFYISINEKNFDFSAYRIRLLNLFDILKLGFPSFVTEFSTGLVMACFNFIILKIAGNTGIAAYSIIANIAIVVAALFTGIAQGIQPLISFNFGADNQQKVKKISCYAYILSTFIGLFLYVLFYLFTDCIIQTFNKDNDLLLITMANSGIRIYFLSLIFMGANIITTSILSSKAMHIRSFVLSILRACVIVIPLLFILGNLFGLKGVWASVPLTEIITMLIFIKA